MLEAAAEPLDSRTWRAAVQVTLARTAGDPATLGRLGETRFARAVARELARWGAKRRCLRIVRAVWTAATTPRPWRPASTPSGQAPWNAPASPWTTGTTPSASSPTSSSA